MNNKDLNNSSNGNRGAFVTVWEIPAGDVLHLVTQGSFTIDWGDGTVKEVKGRKYNKLKRIKHKYEKPGAGPNSQRTVSIYGGITRFFAGNPDKDVKKLIDIQQWGTAKWEDMSGMFEFAYNVICSATDTPVLSQVLNMQCMFYDCRKFNSPIQHWDFSAVENMGSILSGALAFDQDLRKLQVNPKANANFLFGPDKSLDEYNEEYEAKEQKEKDNKTQK